jgi:hypothetical protein
MSNAFGGAQPKVLR